MRTASMKLSCRRTMRASHAKPISRLLTIIDRQIVQICTQNSRVCEDTTELSDLRILRSTTILRSVIRICFSTELKKTLRACSTCGCDTDFDEPRAGRRRARGHAERYSGPQLRGPTAQREARAGAALADAWAARLSCAAMSR